MSKNPQKYFDLTLTKQDKTWKSLNDKLQKLRKRNITP